MSDDRPKRPGSMSGDDRDLSGAQARRLRTYPQGVPTKADPEDTGQCETYDERVAMRSRRTTEERVTKLEDKTDKLLEGQARTEGAVAVVNEKTDGQTRLIEEIRQSVDRIARRDDITFQSKVTVHQATALDTIDAAKTRRWLIAKAIGAIVGGGSLLEVIHWIAGKL